MRYYEYGQMEYGGLPVDLTRWPVAITASRLSRGIIPYAAEDYVAGRAV